MGQPPALIDWSVEQNINLEDLDLHKAPRSSSAYMTGVSTSLLLLKELWRYTWKSYQAQGKRARKQASVRALETMEWLRREDETVLAHCNTDGMREVLIPSAQVAKRAGSIPLVVFKSYPSDTRKMRLVLEITTQLYFDSKQRSTACHSEIMMGLPNQRQPEILASLHLSPAQTPGRSVAQVLHNYRNHEIIGRLENKLKNDIKDAAEQMTDSLARIAPVRPWTPRHESQKSLEVKLKTLTRRLGPQWDEKILPELEQMIKTQRSSPRTRFIDLSLKNILLDSLPEDYLERGANIYMADSDKLGESVDARYDLARLACFPWSTLKADDFLDLLGPNPWEYVFMYTLSKICLKTQLPEGGLTTRELEKRYFEHELDLLYRSREHVASIYPRLCEMLDRIPKGELIKDVLIDEEPL